MDKPKKVMYYTEKSWRAVLNLIFVIYLRDLGDLTDLRHIRDLKHLKNQG